MQKKAVIHCDCIIEKSAITEAAKKEKIITTFLV